MVTPGLLFIVFFIPLISLILLLIGVGSLAIHGRKRISAWVCTLLGLPGVVLFTYGYIRQQHRDERYSRAHAELREVSSTAKVLAVHLLAYYREHPEQFQFSDQVPGFENEFAIVRGFASYCKSVQGCAQLDLRIDGDTFKDLRENPYRFAVDRNQDGLIAGGGGSFTQDIRKSPRTLVGVFFNDSPEVMGGGFETAMEER